MHRATEGWPDPIPLSIYSFLTSFSLKEDYTRTVQGRRTATHVAALLQQQWAMASCRHPRASYSRRFTLHAYYIIQTATHNNVRSARHVHKSCVSQSRRVEDSDERTTGPIAFKDVVPRKRPHVHVDIRYYRNIHMQAFHEICIGICNIKVSPLYSCIKYNFYLYLFKCAEKIVQFSFRCPVVFSIIFNLCNWRQLYAEFISS